MNVPKITRVDVTIFNYIMNYVLHSKLFLTHSYGFRQLGMYHTGHIIHFYNHFFMVLFHPF